MSVLVQDDVGVLGVIGSAVAEVQRASAGRFVHEERVVAAVRGMRIHCDRISDNAAVAGVLVPLLTLGLPTSATAAILLVAFQQYGLQPGPLLFSTSGPLVWTLIASLYIGNVMLLILNLPLVGLWVRLLSIPAPLLYGGILVFSSLGVYSLNRSTFDLALLLIMGVIGYLMRRFGFPTAPCIIGLILGPLAEENMRRALSISQGDWSVFATHPISLVLLLLSAAMLLLPVFWKPRAV